MVQQSQGRVSASTSMQGKDAVAINSDPGLEREADVLGARAARGERVFGGQGRATASAGAVQRKPDGQQGGEQGGLRELTPDDLDQLYPPEHFIPVSLSAFTSQVVQPAFTARRPLGRGPKWTSVGRLYHTHIFFEDGGDPANIGHLGPGGLGQDRVKGYTRIIENLDDARMRQAVANVGNPGAYSLLRSNCQHYVARVVAEYNRLEAEKQGGQ